MTKWTINELAYAKGTSEPVRQALLAMHEKLNALEQPEQEPVAWVVYSSAENDIVWADKGKRLKQNTPLYTYPLQQQAEPVHGDIRALKYRIFELEGEVIGYKRMLDVAEAPPQRKPLTDEIPIGVLTAITNAKLTLLKTAHGYELRKLGPIVAGLSMKGEA